MFDYEGKSPLFLADLYHLPIKNYPSAFPFEMDINLPEEYFIILSHLENLIIVNLIMWEIRWSYSRMKVK